MDAKKVSVGEMLLCEAVFGELRTAGECLANKKILMYLRTGVHVFLDYIEDLQLHRLI